ncbi:MAG: M20/M25/M40 family metallo-hydrolase [Anaerolineales bacterium]|nr:M20/M25/M40 family metallo-hydrolase [Anaerolineales bacterium]
MNSTQEKPKILAAQIKLLERLSNACAVSGDEGAVRKIVLEQIKYYADQINTDALGNVLAIKHGRGRNRPKVMLAAHMDEVGFILIHDEGGGLYRFNIAGGIDTRNLAGKQVLVGPEEAPGLIGTSPIHLTSASDKKNGVPLNNLRIDIGPGNTGKFKIGTRAAFATRFSRLGPSLRGKALDDRVGVASLIALLQHAPENIDLMAAFTVQEEVGLRGAKVAAHTFNPDMGIALDCTPSLDMPAWDGRENVLYRSKIGLGPAIYVGDGSTLSDPRLISLLRKTGDEENIPYQLRQPGLGGTDAGAIHLSRAGIPAVSVSVPGRYLHTPASLIRLKDWQNSVALIHAALTRITLELLKSPR